MQRYQDNKEHDVTYRELFENKRMTEEVSAQTDKKTGERQAAPIAK